jgi:hypothetical protein
MVVAAITYYTMDINWYANSGATSHIISELDKLAIQDMYNGIEMAHTTSGTCMEISHADNSFIHTQLANLNYAIVDVFCIGKI